MIDKPSLEKYLEKIAADHVLQSHADQNTYPMQRLQNNFRNITQTYRILNDMVKRGISIHPARRMGIG